MEREIKAESITTKPPIGIGLIEVRSPWDHHIIQNLLYFTKLYLFPDKIVECWHFFSPEEPFVKCYKSWDKNKTVLRTHRYIWHFVFDVRHVPRFLHLWIYQTFKGLLNPVCGLRTCVKKFLHLIWSIKDNYLAAWAAGPRPRMTKSPLGSSGPYGHAEPSIH